MEFKIETLPQDFSKSIKTMEKRVNNIIGQNQDEMVWILNYPAIYTCGASENRSDLIENSKFPIFKFSIVQFIICGLLLLFYGIIFENNDFLEFDKINNAGFFYLLYCSLGSVCIGFTLQMYGQKLVEPTSAALIMSSEAIFAAFFGWMILSEILSFYGIIGASLIFLGIIFIQLAPRYSGE